jgi:serine/threonine protein kinase
MQKHGGWELIEPPLGKGGQGVVYKARNPTRVAERSKCLEQFRDLMNRARFPEFAEASWLYARPDLPSELGALKIFAIPDSGKDADEAIGRLKNEAAVLRENRLGLIKLLDANEEEHWMVTELMPGGTLEKHQETFKGNALGALRAFRTLVETVASLHEEKRVHRDIKPANVFIQDDGHLVLGDFGIVYLPDQQERLTCTDERVGSRTYMPTWADMGDRLEKVDPNFDVYMLGKLLWSMVSGRLKLPFWYRHKPQFDLTVKFPSDEHMYAVNSILDKCIVEFSEDCIASAQELLALVSETLSRIESGAPQLGRNGGLRLPCRVCGKGFYQSDTLSGTLRFPTYDDHKRTIGEILIRTFVCNVCTHYQFFAPGNPDDAAIRGWKP